MILVDIQVPAIGQSFDFELDEEMSTEDAAAKVVSLIADREEMQTCYGEKMYFYAPDKEMLLRQEYSLKQQGIRGGEKLIMI